MARSRPGSAVSGSPGTTNTVLCVTALLVSLILPAAARALARQSGTSATPPAASSPSANAPSASALPRGTKLFLKDGSFQLVREYKVEGDRIRYYDLVSSSWQEMPASLVDWDATKKAEAEQSKQDSALLAKVHAQEEARQIQPLDIDASLEVAPGVFLPPGDNLFVFNGKSVLALPQAETTSKVSKQRLLEQVLIPIPIVPSRQNVSIQGAHAKFRLQTGTPEFYIRTADAREPHLELIRTKPHGETRLIEHLDQLMGEHQEVRDTLPMQKWEVARGVYRFTLGQALAPGEYALAAVLDDEEVSLFVWDFGVDAGSSSVAQKAK